MDRLRRSFRESFRSGRRSSKDRAADTSKPQEWQADEATVRAGTCSFQVKYLGCVEVFESRGMQTCEEALKVLRSSRKRRIRGILYVSGDGLRVVDAENKGLVVDQTIEKVSFCAPDRNHDRGFAYICRDGTTRRWMCHGFHAAKESGERLSHAVGCAFAVCLERKQKRDREAATLQQLTSASGSGTPLATTASAPPLIGASPPGATSESPSSFASTTPSNFQRGGSFRQASLTERIIDPQNVKPAEKPPLKPIVNPHAVSRPHANPQLFERQGSLRLGPNSAPTSPFRRNYSLRLNELPSNLARQHTSENGRHGSIAFDSTIAESEHEESSLDLTASSAHQTFAMSGPSTCQPLSETFSQQLSLNDSPQFTTPRHSAFDNAAASTSQPPSARSKADEWLESAATTARSIQQRRLSPPAQRTPAAVITPPARSTDRRTSQPTAPVLTKATSDSFSVLDSAGGEARQQSAVLLNGGGVATNGFAPTMVAPVSFGYQPLLDTNFVVIPTAVPPPLVAPPTAAPVDVFGQPVFNGVPQPPPVPTRSPATMTASARGAAAPDPFEAKWQALGASTRTPPPPPNPFSHESSAVNI